jgi:hypothetical protein
LTKIRVDAVARFEYAGAIGHGLFEHWALGPHPGFPADPPATA